MQSWFFFLLLPKIHMDMVKCSHHKVIWRYNDRDTEAAAEAIKQRSSEPSTHNIWTAP